MTLTEKAKEFDEELTNLKVSELVEPDCQNLLYSIKQKIDDFLGMIKFSKRSDIKFESPIKHRWKSDDKV